MRSRLAVAARDALEESDRLALIGRLFGDSITPHWAPKDAADVIFEIDPAVAAEPERALRDTLMRISGAIQVIEEELAKADGHGEGDPGQG